MGTGAESVFRAGRWTVVAGGVPGGESASLGASISPGQATTVWLQGASSDER